MFEVKAYDLNGAEIELVGTNATQSSTFGNNDKFAASKAVDGDSTTFSHTNDADAFWKVDLAQGGQIGTISVENRWCKNRSDPSGCLCRLSNATVSLLDRMGDVVTTASFGNTCGDLNPGLSFDSCVSYSLCACF